MGRHQRKSSEAMGNRPLDRCVRDYSINHPHLSCIGDVHSSRRRLGMFFLLSLINHGSFQLYKVKGIITIRTSTISVQEKDLNDL